MFRICLDGGCNLSPVCKKQHIQQPHAQAIPVTKPDPDKTSPIPISTLLEQWELRLAASRSTLEDAKGVWDSLPKVPTTRREGREKHDALLQVSAGYRHKVAALQAARKSLTELRDRQSEVGGLAAMRWVSSQQLKLKQRQVRRLRTQVREQADRVSPAVLAPVLKQVAAQATRDRRTQNEVKRDLLDRQSEFQALHDGAGKLMALERAGVALLDLTDTGEDAGCIAAMDNALRRADAQRKSPSGNDAALVSRLLLSHRHWKSSRKSDPSWSEEARSDMVALVVAIRRRKVARELLASRYGTIWDEVVSLLPPPPAPPEKGPQDAPAQAGAQKPDRPKADRRHQITWDGMGQHSRRPIRKGAALPRP
ncbi:MAG: hypothetical protein Alpg2KO_23640 [Alphaproteobacteria bacterium]